MKRILILLFVLITILIFNSCYKKEKTISIEGFNQFEWQKDSLACNKYRFTHYELLFNYRKILNGVKEKDIIEFLGNPNYKQSNSDQVIFSYFITKGEQCLLDGNKLKIKENPLFRIIIKNGLVYDVNIIIP